MTIEEIIKKRTFLIQTELGLSNRERNLIEFQIKELVKQLNLCGVSNRRELLLSYHKFLQEYLSLDLSDVWVNEHLKDNNCC